MAESKYLEIYTRRTLVRGTAQPDVYDKKQFQTGRNLRKAWAEMPVSERGWGDNVTCNEHIAVHMAAGGEDREYDGPALGNFRLELKDYPSNRHLKAHIKKLEKQANSSRKAADRENSDDDVTVASDDQSGTEEAEQGGVSDDESLEDNTRTRTMEHRELTRDEIARLKAHLHIARALITRGVANAHHNDVSSVHAIPRGISVPGLDHMMDMFKPHQLDGAGRYEHTMRELGGVILGDDPGTGKSFIILLATQRTVNEAKRQGKSVLVAIVVPKALVTTWKTELARSKTLRVADCSDEKVRSMTATQIKDSYDVIIIPQMIIAHAYGRILQTYIYHQAYKEGFEDDIQALMKKPFAPGPDKCLDDVLFALDLDELIVDEGQHIKNPDILLSQGLRVMNAKRRAVVTGTPLQNTVMELGALIGFLRIKPFDNLALFRSVFTNKRKRGKRVEKSTRDNNRWNAAALSALRSALCIRRTSEQHFDGKPITEQPISAVHVRYPINQGPESIEFQAQTRDIWDWQWKKNVLKRAQEAKDTLAPDDPEYIRCMEELAQIPQREYNEILPAMLHARLHLIHPGLLIAKYGVDEFNAEDFAREIKAIGAGSRDISPGETRNIPVARGPLLTNKQHAAFSKRRAAFLAHYNNVNNNDWASDRTSATVRVLKWILKDHQAAAEKLKGVERNKYIATHKILVFCEFLAGLDLVDIGLQRCKIKCLRFDGSLSQQERDNARNLFEEKGKDFELPDTRPDEHQIMLMTNRAGHEGITLVHGTDTVLMSPNWNPYTEKQMEGRENRKGQKGSVTVHRLFSQKCIEDRIHMAMHWKRSAVEKVMSDTLILENEAALVGADEEGLLNILRFDVCASAMLRGTLTL